MDMLYTEGSEVGNRGEPTEFSTENETDLIVQDTATRNGAKKRRRTSPIWNHFTMIEDGKCVCNYCKKLIKGGGINGTHGLHQHYAACPELNDKKKRNDGSVKGGLHVFDENESRKLLAHMIIKHEYPLIMVEHQGFRDFCKSLQPWFTVISRSTIKRDILKIYEVEKEKTMSLLSKNSSRIAITTDMWTSNNQKRGFMSVTAHFIDESWVLNSRLVRFIYVPCPHTAEVLADALLDCVTEWGMDTKLSALTVDNCSTNDAMLDDLLGRLTFITTLIDGELFHMRCCAHILNLIVRDGLDVISASIEKIRACIAYWTATPKREEKFSDIVKAMNFKNPTKLILDWRTRWNSTFLMLQSALKYKDIFARLKREYKAIPNDQDWELIKVLVDKLNVFYKVTLLFSGTQYPTANLYFPNVCNIRIGINNWLHSEHSAVRSMAEKMSLKFDKYWTTIHGMMTIATIVDPRYKMELIEYYFPIIYPEMHTFQVERIRELAKNITSTYQQNLQVGYGSSQSSLSQSSMLFDLEDDGLASFDAYVSSKMKKDSFKSELDDYLGEKLVPRTKTSAEFDILQWWKVNGMRYPTLQAMAKDVLAIPVSTVASESTFSTSGRVVSPHRSRLHPDTLEALMCARDWMWNEMKAARTISKNDSTFDDDFDLAKAMKENVSLYD